MRYIKLYESFEEFEILKLRSLKDRRVYDNEDEYYMDTRSKESDFTKEDELVNLLNKSGLEYEFVEKNYKGKVIHFKTPKRFDKFSANTHVYSPADLYYTVRVAEYSDEWFIFQWFGQCYATQEHMLNYYREHPHFAPGGRMHTFTNKDGVESLCYQPPLYNGYYTWSFGDSFANIGHDQIGQFYLCDQWHSLSVLLNDFINFLNQPNVARFVTDYPLS